MGSGTDASEAIVVPFLYEIESEMPKSKNATRAPKQKRASRAATQPRMTTLAMTNVSSSFVEAVVLTGRTGRTYRVVCWQCKRQKT